MLPPYYQPYVPPENLGYEYLLKDIETAKEHLKQLTEIKSKRYTEAKWEATNRMGRDGCRIALFVTIPFIVIGFLLTFIFMGLTLFKGSKTYFIAVYITGFLTVIIGLINLGFYTHYNERREKIISEILGN